MSLGAVDESTNDDAEPDREKTDTEDTDNVQFLRDVDVLLERDELFNKQYYITLTNRQKEWVMKCSKASAGRAQTSYERDAYVVAIQGLVALCFDATVVFKSQPQALDRALKIFHESQLGHLPDVLPSIFGTTTLIRTFRDAFRRKANTFKVSEKHKLKLNVALASGVNVKTEDGTLDNKSTTKNMDTSTEEKISLPCSYFHINKVQYLFISVLSVLSVLSSLYNFLPLLNAYMHTYRHVHAYIYIYIYIYMYIYIYIYTYIYI